jgi:hypothetical protein
VPNVPEWQSKERLGAKVWSGCCRQVDDRFVFDRCHNLIAVHEVHIDNGSFTMSEEPVNDTRNNRDCAADSDRSMMTNN